MSFRLIFIRLNIFIDFLPLLYYSMSNDISVSGAAGDY